MSTNNYNSRNMRNILALCYITLSGCGIISSRSPQTKSTTSEIPAIGQCEKMANESRCSKNYAKEQLECLEHESESLHRCIDSYGTDWVKLKNEANKEMLSNINQKAEKEKGPLQAELMKQKQIAKELQRLSADYKEIIDKSSKDHALFFGDSFKRFKDTSKYTADEMKISLEKLESNSVDDLLKLKYNLTDLQNKIAAASAETRLSANLAKSKWNLTVNYYQDNLKVYEAYFQENGVTTLDPFTSMIPQLDNAISFVDKTQTSMQNRVSEAHAAIDRRIDKLILIASDAETRKKSEGIKIMNATAKFMEHVNSIKKDIYAPPKQYSNGFLDIETRHTELTQFLQNERMCDDEKTSQGSWKHAGCVLLLPEIEGVKNYLEVTLPVFLSQEITKLGAVEDGRAISQAKQARSSLKAGRIAEAITIYTNTAKPNGAQ